MNSNRTWCLVSGVLVLGTSLLGVSHHPYWLFVTVLAGLDLLQSGFTNNSCIAWFCSQK